MRRLREILFRLQPLFRKRKVEADLSEEIQAHLEMAIEASVAAGMSPAEARYAAGGPGSVSSLVTRFQREGRTETLEFQALDSRFAS